MVGLIEFVFRVFELLILARVLLSWIPVDPYNQIVRFIVGATEPILAPIRRYMPANMPFDLSPLAALLIAIILENVLLQIFR